MLVLWMKRKQDRAIIEHIAGILIGAYREVQKLMNEVNLESVVLSYFF